MASRIAPAVVDDVLDRAGGYCEACGWPMRAKMDFHHRQLRSHGGGDTVDNLMWVHHSCHVVSAWAIHQNPARSYRLGHMVPAGSDPLTLPFETCLQLRQLRE